jgi:hypothetical protein
MDRIDPQPHQHSPGARTARDVGDILMAARVADHLAHCPGCREQGAASAAATAANGASMARRDRLTLGLRNAKQGASA